MAARYQYVCPDCENTVALEKAVKRIPGNKGMCRPAVALMCENHNDGHREMKLEEYTPERRVRRDW